MAHSLNYTGTNLRSPDLTRHLIGYAYWLIAALMLAPELTPAQLLHPVIAACLGVLAVYDFLLALDDSPAIREIAGLIAVVQNVVGPSILYSAFNLHPRYRMYVDEQYYFTFAVPATCLLLIGLRLRLPIGTSQFRAPLKDAGAFQTGMLLVLIGLCAGSLSRFAPGSLAFVLYIVSNFRYVGAIYVYMSGHRFRWPVIGAVVGGMFLTSASHGMFHEILLWGSLGGCYWFIGQHRTMKTKISLVCLAVALIVVIQAIKPVYRAALSRGEKVSIVGTAGDVVQSDAFLSEDSLEYLTVRISQGWIASAAMSAVPSHIPHANGETVVDALEAALLPRILFPDKIVASTRENVNRYTHLEIGETTAMGLGPLGESWVNFGRFGGIAMMFCFGLLLNGVFHLMGRMSWIDSFFYFCLPLVFLQAVKAETEMLTVFNHLTKAMILIWATFFSLRSVGALRIDQRPS